MKKDQYIIHNTTPVTFSTLALAQQYAKQVQQSTGVLLGIEINNTIKKIETKQ